MEKLRLYKDAETGFLWYVNDTHYPDGYIDLNEGRQLDLTLCEELTAEVVSTENLQFTMSAGSLITIKDDKGMLSVMTIHNLMNSEYRSILPGFTFKSAYAFECNWDMYVVAENDKGKWGVIRISHMHEGPWYNGEFCFSYLCELVRFECKSLEEAIEKTCLKFSPADIKIPNCASPLCNLAEPSQSHVTIGGSDYISGKTKDTFMYYRRTGLGNHSKD